MKNALIVIFTFTAVCHAAAAGELVLAERGKSAQYTIVAAEKPAPSVWTAVNELRTYLERSTGVRLPLANDAGELPERAIVVGPTRHGSQYAETLASLGEEGFRIKADGKRVWIVGSDVHGALFGVYEFLERFCGIGWYASWHEVIPELKRLTVPDDFDLTEKPAFEFRQIGWTDAIRNPLFCARNKANMFGNRPEFGGSKYWFDSVLGKAHTFHALVPVEKYGKDHPEYFAVRDGKRQTSGRTQLCLTNPDVVRIATEAVLERIRANPKCVYFGVSQEDGLRGACQCEKCLEIDEAEGSPAATMILFVNQIAEAVEKAGYTDKIIETLAYGYTRNPPKTVRPRDNVMICLCSSGVEFSRPFNDSRHTGSKRFADELRVWRDRTKHLHLWDYPMNFLDLPHVFPDEMVIAPNLRFFRDCGVTEIYEQGAFQSRHAGFGELKVWLFAKLEWNPDQPLEPLLERFFKGYYGKGAKYVREIFNAYHSLPVDEVAMPLTPMDDPCGKRYPKGFFEEQAARWDAALAAVTDEPAYVYNVRWGRFGNDFARVLNAAKDPALKNDPAMRAVAARVAAMIDESEKTDPMRVRLGETANQNAKLEKIIRDMASGSDAKAAPDKKTALEEGMENIFSAKEPAKMQPFADGERVVCLGDSITAQGHWLKALSDFYLTRYPFRRVSFRNAGVGGDSAGGCVRRLDEDVRPGNPTTLTVMFGMNDAGIANYRGTNSTPAQIAARPRSTAAFKANSDALEKRLRKDYPGAKIVWLGSSPYDDVSDKRFPGAGAAVAACAKETQQLSRRTGDAFVDFNLPMTEFNESGRKRDPAFTLCGSDGVHPREAGGLFMAYRILKAQGVSPVVSSVAVDARNLKLLSAENAELCGLGRDKSGISFRLTEKALPFPVDPAAAKVADMLPFADDISRQVLKVAGLEPGRWILKIDGETVLEASAGEFAAGIDLARNEKTPMMRQARAVAAANAVICSMQSNRQTLSAVRHFIIKRYLKDRADDLAAVKAFVEENRDNPKLKRDYYSRFLDKYLKEWPNRAEQESDIASRIEALEPLRKPKAHEFSVVRIASE